MTAVAIYCRVSTDDQEKEGTSLQTQLEACLKYCQEKGYQAARRFSETYSGLTVDRPELIKLRNLVRANEIDVVVVYSLDRLSRDPTHGVLLRAEREDHHVSLESVSEDIDNSELGKTISYLYGFASKLEAEKIRERTMRGKLARVKEGKLPQGTGIGIYGYNWDKETGKRTINEYETKVIQKIFSMVLDGVSFNKIAIELNKQAIKSKSGRLFHPLTVRRIVSNETYTGKTFYGMSRRVGKTKVSAQPRENWTLLPDITPPIISEEVFKRAQEAVKQAKLARPIKPKAAYLLTGFIRCSKCGSSIGGTTLNGKYRYYKCRGSTPTATRGNVCDSGYIRAERLEKDVWSKVHDMLTSPLTLFACYADDEVNRREQPKQANTLQLLEKQIAQLRRKLKAYGPKERRLYSLLTSEAITKDLLLDEVDSLKRGKANDEQLLKQLLATRNQANKADHATIKLSDVSKFLRQKACSQDPNNSPTDNLEENRQFLENLRLEVLYDPETKNFKLTFRLGAQIISDVDPVEEAQWNRNLIEFETQHPDIDVRDWVNLDKPLPGDSAFAKAVNHFKQKLRTDLVTTEQTSGCAYAFKRKKVLLF